ncbi:hypothetical protein I79_017196 [Cricetulus griseus]|uniref:Uncharacterized protein n=1 Tax=Cricetulus griseus TaxID=10029 RepID=G3I1E3_CRIGR|nr:hypothetical protein I79_017196 [Cricetulus griseus]
MNYTFKNYLIPELEVPSCDGTPRTMEKMKYNLNHWFSTLLMLQPFHTVPHVVMTPTMKLFLLLLHNCNFC